MTIDEYLALDEAARKKFIDGDVDQKQVTPVEQGNIDLTTRPVVSNPDGTISTVRSKSFNFDGQEVLLPTISDDGRGMTDDETVQQYLSTGKHLGKFSTPEEATTFAQELSRQQGENKAMGSLNFRPVRFPDEVQAEQTKEKPGYLTQFKNDFGRSVDGLQMMAGGLLATVGEATGNLGAYSVGLDMLEANSEEMKKNPALIGSFQNINSADDAVRYLIEAVGENAMYMLPGVVTGGVSGIVARRVMTTMAAEAIEGLVAKGASREVAARAVAMSLKRQAAEKVAENVASGVGAYASSAAMETGSIAGDMYEQTGRIDPGLAITGGLAAGALDAIPNYGVIKMALGGQAAGKVAKELEKGLGRDVFETLLKEAPTEVVQTIIEKATVAQKTGENIFEEEDLVEYADAALKSGAGSIPVAVGGHMLGKLTRGSTTPELDKSFEDAAPRDSTRANTAPAPSLADAAAIFEGDDEDAQDAYDEKPGSMVPLGGTTGTPTPAADAAANETTAGTLPTNTATAAIPGAIVTPASGKTVTETISPAPATQSVVDQTISKPQDGQTAKSTGSYPVDAGSTPAPATPDLEEVQGRLNSLSDGDTIVTDAGDRIEATNVLRNKDGNVTGIVTPKEDGAGFASIKFDGLVALVTPQPYIDSATGERKFSSPATIEKLKTEPGDKDLVAPPVAESTTPVTQALVSNDTPATPAIPALRPVKSSVSGSEIGYQFKEGLDDEATGAFEVPGILLEESEVTGGGIKAALKERGAKNVRVTTSKNGDARIFWGEEDGKSRLDLKRVTTEADGKTRYYGRSVEAGALHSILQKPGATPATQPTSGEIPETSLIVGADSKKETPAPYTPEDKAYHFGRVVDEMEKLVAERDNAALELQLKSNKTRLENGQKPVSASTLDRLQRRVNKAQRKIDLMQKFQTGIEKGRKAEVARAFNYYGTSQAPKDKAKRKPPTREQVDNAFTRDSVVQKIIEAGGLLSKAELERRGTPPTGGEYDDVPNFTTGQRSLIFNTERGLTADEMAPIALGDGATASDLWARLGEIVRREERRPNDAPQTYDEAMEQMEAGDNARRASQDQQISAAPVSKVKVASLPVGERFQLIRNGEAKSFTVADNDPDFLEQAEIVDDEGNTETLNTNDEIEVRRTPAEAETQVETPETEPVVVSEKTTQVSDTTTETPAVTTTATNEATTPEPQAGEDYFNGDRIRYTDDEAPEGFRSFVYLDGPKAGTAGVARTPEAKQADLEKSQSDYKEQQEKFRALRESGKSDQMPKSEPVVEQTPAVVLTGEAAEDADYQIALHRADKHYTLWGGSSKAGNWTYLTILGQNYEEAKRKAIEVGRKIMSGEKTGVAFYGKAAELSPGKTVGLIDRVLTEQDLARIAPRTEIGQQPLGFGKRYADVLVDDLPSVSMSYVEWMVGEANKPGAGRRLKDIVEHLKNTNTKVLEMIESQRGEQDRIKAYEERQANKGKTIPAQNLSTENTTTDNKIEERKVEKKTARKASDQIVDIVAPNKDVKNVVPPRLAKNMFPIQVAGANATIASLDQSGASLNGDGAGVGKTRQIVAVADHYARQGLPVIIITENAAIGKPWEGNRRVPVLGGSMAKDSQAMGVSLKLLDNGETPNAGEIRVSTYNRIEPGQIPNNAVVIFDESQNLANTFGDISKPKGEWKDKFSKIFTKAGRIAFYSATPADKPHQLAYLYKVLGFGSPQEYLDAALENGMVERKRKFGKTEIKFYDVPSKSPTKLRKLYGWVNGLIQQAGVDGRAIKREISYEGTDIQFHDTTGTNVAKNPWAEKFLGVMAQLQGYAAENWFLPAFESHVLYSAELAKIGDAVDMVKRELAAGRKAVLFFSRIREHAIRGRKRIVNPDGTIGLSDPVTLGTIPSPVELLRDELNKLGISFAELHGESDDTSKTAQEKFSSSVDVLLASVESGGTGINLDDPTGKNPRTEIFMFAPYRGISTIQAMGRIWRSSTVQDDNKPNRYIFVVASDIGQDATRSAVLAKKLQLMNASLGGTAVSRLPMSKVGYSPDQLAGLELPDDGEESPLMQAEEFAPGPLLPIQIDWKQSKRGNWWSPASADLLEWMERGGPERTGTNVRVFKGTDGRWVVFSEEPYTADKFELKESEKTTDPTPIDSTVPDADPTPAKTQEEAEAVEIVSTEPARRGRPRKQRVSPEVDQEADEAATRGFYHYNTRTKNFEITEDGAAQSAKERERIEAIVKRENDKYGRQDRAERGRAIRQLQKKSTMAEAVTLIGEGELPRIITSAKSTLRSAIGRNGWGIPSDEAESIALAAVVRTLHSPTVLAEAKEATEDKSPSAIYLGYAITNAINDAKTWMLERGQANEVSLNQNDGEQTENTAEAVDVGDDEIPEDTTLTGVAPGELISADASLEDTELAAIYENAGEVMGRMAKIATKNLDLYTSPLNRDEAGIYLRWVLNPRRQGPVPIKDNTPSGAEARAAAHRAILDARLQIEAEMTRDSDGEETGENIDAPENTPASFTPVIPQEMYASALKALRAELNKLGMGVDPTILKHLIVVGAYHAERGARKFGHWAERMVSDVGEEVAGVLKKVYARVKSLFRGVKAGFDKTADVRTAKVPTAVLSKEEIDSIVVRSVEAGSHTIPVLPDSAGPKQVEMTLDLNKERIFSLLGERMYNSDLSWVVVKETLQNSFDGIKDAEALGTIPVGSGMIGYTYSEDTPNNKVAMTFADNGIGMTPDILQTAFFRVGGTHKRSGKASGGFGLAKMGMFMSAERIYVETVNDGTVSVVDVSKEQLLSDKFNVSVSEDLNRKNGTLVRIEFPLTMQDTNGKERKFSKPWFEFSKVITYDLGFINDTVQQQDLEAWFRGDSIEDYYNKDKFQKPTRTLPLDSIAEKLPNTERRTETIGGVTLNAVISRLGYKDKDGSGKYSEQVKSDDGTIEITVDNSTVSVMSNGLAQFKQGSLKVDPKDYFGENLPYAILIDVDAGKIDASSTEYPFTNSREGFRGGAVKKFVDDLVSELQTREKLKRFDDEFSGVTGFDGAPADKEKPNYYNNTTHEPTQEEMAFLKELSGELFNVADFWVGELRQAESQDLLSDTENWSSVRLKGTSVTEQVRWGDDKIDYFYGVGLSKNWAGVNTSREPTVVLLNPVYHPKTDTLLKTELGRKKLAGWYAHTLMHELNHALHRNEGADFTWGMTQTEPYLSASGAYSAGRDRFEDIINKHIDAIASLKEGYSNAETKDADKELTGRNTSQPSRVSGQADRVGSGNSGMGTLAAKQIPGESGSVSGGGDAQANRGGGVLGEQPERNASADQGLSFGEVLANTARKLRARSRKPQDTTGELFGEETPFNLVGEVIPAAPVKPDTVVDAEAREKAFRESGKRDVDDLFGGLQARSVRSRGSRTARGRLAADKYVQMVRDRFPGVTLKVDPNNEDVLYVESDTGTLVINPDKFADVLPNNPTPEAIDRVVASLVAHEVAHVATLNSLTSRPELQEKFQALQDWLFDSGKWKSVLRSYLWDRPGITDEELQAFVDENGEEVVAHEFLRMQGELAVRGQTSEMALWLSRSPNNGILDLVVRYLKGLADQINHWYRKTTNANLAELLEELHIQTDKLTKPISRDMIEHAAAVAEVSAQADRVLLRARTRPTYERHTETFKNSIPFFSKTVREALEKLTYKGENMEELLGAAKESLLDAMRRGGEKFGVEDAFKLVMAQTPAEGMDKNMRVATQLVATDWFEQMAKAFKSKQTSTGDYLAEYYDGKAADLRVALAAEHFSPAGQTLAIASHVYKKLRDREYGKMYTKAAAAEQEREFGDDPAAGKVEGAIDGAVDTAAAGTVDKAQGVIDGLIKKARTKLRNLGLTDAQLAELETTVKELDALKNEKAIDRDRVVQAVADKLANLIEKAALSAEDQEKLKRLPGFETILKGTVSRMVRQQFDSYFNEDAKETDTDEQKEARRQKAINSLVSEVQNLDLARAAFEATKAELYEKLDNDGESNLNEEQLDIIDSLKFDETNLPMAVRVLKASLNMREEVRKSLTAQRTNVNRLAHEIAELSGLSPEQAVTVARALKAEYEKAAKVEIEKAIEQLVKSNDPEIRKAIKSKSTHEKLFEAANLGALRRQAVWNAIAPNYGLPSYDPAFVREIEQRAERIQTLAEDSQQRNLETRLLMTDIAYRQISEAKGAAKKSLRYIDTFLALWKAGILSGPPTQVVNFGFSHVNSLLSAAANARALSKMAKKSGNKEAKSYFGYLGQLLSGTYSQLGRAKQESANALRYGWSRFQNEKIESLGLLEGIKFDKNDPWKLSGILAPAKYVGRFMQATDALNSSMASEMAQRAAVESYILQHKLSKEEANQLRANVFDNSEEIRKKATAQADKEMREGQFGGQGKAAQSLYRSRIEQLVEIEREKYIPGIIQLGRSEGERIAFNQPADRLIGFVMRGLFAPLNRTLRATQILMPFPNTVANLLNTTLDYTPYGYLRANNISLSDILTNAGKLSDEFAPKKIEKGSFEYEQAVSKAWLGTIGIAAILSMVIKGLLERDDDPDKEPWFEITGEGPADLAAQEQLKTTGWMPYTVKIGGLRLRYTDWPALNMVMGVFGTITDNIVYNKGKGIAPLPAIISIFATTLDRNMLSGLSDFFQIVNNPNQSGANKLSRIAFGTVGGVTNPNLVRWLRNTFATDETGMVPRLEQRTLTGKFAALAPFSAGYDGVSMNVLGEPIRSFQAEATTNRFGSFFDKSHPTLSPLAEVGLFLKDPSYQVVFSVPKAGKIVDYKLTPDEQMEFTKVRGPILKKALTKVTVARLTALAKRDYDAAKDELQKLTMDVTKQAKQVYAKRKGWVQ